MELSEILREEKNKNLKVCFGLLLVVVALAAAKVTASSGHLLFDALQLLAWLGILFCLFRSARAWTALRKLKTAGSGESAQGAAVRSNGSRTWLIALIAVMAALAVGYFALMARYQYVEGPVGLTFRIDKWTGEKQWYNPRTKTWD